jgi:hypothetical protein
VRREEFIFRLFPATSGFLRYVRNDNLFKGVAKLRSESQLLGGQIKGSRFFGSPSN